MEIDADNLDIPTTEYDARVTMPSSEFTRIARDLSLLGESVKIEVSKEGVRFSSEGEAANASILLKQTDAACKKYENYGKDVKTEDDDDDKEEGGSKKTKKSKVKKEDKDVDMDEADDNEEKDEDGDGDGDGEFKAKSDDEGEDEKEEEDSEEERPSKKRKKAPSKKVSGLLPSYSSPYTSVRMPSLRKRPKRIRMKKVPRTSAS